MKRNRFMYFASLLNKGSNKRKKHFVSLEEEAEFNKLEFFWENCQPQDLEDLDILTKTLRKIEEGKPEPVSMPKKQFRIGFKVASIAAVAILLIGLTFFLRQEEYVIQSIWPLLLKG